MNKLIKLFLGTTNFQLFVNLIQSWKKAGKCMLIQTKKSVTYYSLFFLATNNLWSKSATGHQGPSAVFVRLNTTEAGARQRVTVRHRSCQLIWDLRHSNVSAARRLHGNRSTLCQLFSRRLKLAFLATQAHYTNYSTRRECRQWEIHAVFCHVVMTTTNNNNGLNL